MNDRIHRYLDGELPRESLTAGELQEADAFERLAVDAAHVYGAIEVPDLEARVMARLPAEAHGRRTAGATSVHAAGGSSSSEGARAGTIRKALGWLWTPRPIRLRPAYGFAMAALLALVMLPDGPGGPAMEGLDLRPGAEAETAAAAAGEEGGSVAAGMAAKVFVQFRLDAPEASGVRLAGSFSQWEPEHALHEMAPGVWSILLPLEPGVHDYVFLVDGEEWTIDPVAPAVDDGFGGQNSRLSVFLPGDFAQT